METETKLAWYDEIPNMGAVLLIIGLLLTGFISWRRTGESGYMVVLAMIALLVMAVELYDLRY